MDFIRLPDQDGQPVYALRGAFFYTLRRVIVWRVEFGVWRNSLLDRLYGRWAR